MYFIDWNCFSGEWCGPQASCFHLEKNIWMGIMWLGGKAINSAIKCCANVFYWLELFLRWAMWSTGLLFSFEKKYMNGYNVAWREVLMLMRGHWVGCFASDKNCRCTLLLVLHSRKLQKERGKKINDCLFKEFYLCCNFYLRC